jgi:hypothetical protein
MQRPTQVGAYSKKYKVLEAQRIREITQQQQQLQQPSQNHSRSQEQQQDDERAKALRLDAKKRRL